MKNSKKRGGKKQFKGGSKQDNDIFRPGKNVTYEPSDSDEEYSQKEKMLLEKVRSSSSQSKGKKKVAVMDLPLYEDDDDDDGDNMEEDSDDDLGDENMDSDIEGKEDDFHLPDQRAWGKTKKNYYSTDYVDQDYGGFDGDDAEAAELEEQEALAIQKRLAAELDDNDFTLDVFLKSKGDDKVIQKPSEEVIKTDLSQLSSRQKLALLEKEAPELIGIISEFRGLMEELENRLQPAIGLVQGKQVASPQLIQYIRTKYHLVNNYAMNIGFYLLLRSRRLPVSAHPVVKRLLQFRQLLQQLEPLEELASNQLEELLSAKINGTLPALQENGVDNKKQNKNVQLPSLAKAANESESDDFDDSSSEIEKLPKLKSNLKAVNPKVDAKAKGGIEMPWKNSLDDINKGDAPWTGGITSDDEMDIPEETENQEDSQLDDDGKSKRAITWQMAKNKGLTPRRKKEQRNPRVKHRNKFRKAKIRRKGQVREPRTEVQRYGGEFSGIKKTVTKSIKIK